MHHTRKRFKYVAMQRRWSLLSKLSLPESRLGRDILISYGTSKTWPYVQVIKHLRDVTQTFLRLSVTPSSVAFGGRSCVTVLLIRTPVIITQRLACTIDSRLLIKSYFTVKVCWFDALQHKSLLTSDWFGTPTAEWWMLPRLNTHTRTYTHTRTTIYIYCLNGVVTDTG